MKENKKLTRPVKSDFYKVDLLCFTWEQHKLDDFVNFYQGLTYSPKEIREGGTFVLRSSNVKNNEIISSDDVFVDSNVINVNNVEKGDIIVVVRNGSKALIGKYAKTKENMPHTVIGTFMTGIKSKYPDFTNSLLSTSKFQKEIDENMVIIKCQKLLNSSNSTIIKEQTLNLVQQFFSFQEQSIQKLKAFL